MNIKRILATALLLSMLALTMSSCNKEQGNTEVTTGAVTTEGVTTEDVTTEIPETEQVKEPSMHISADKELSLKLVFQKKYSVDSEYRVGQGACTDGKYAYLIFENNKVTPHMCKIVKVDLSTLNVVKTSEPLPIDHGNDITYNTKTGELFVSHNSPNRTHVSTIDPETLTVKKLTVIDTEIYGITYRESNDTFCLGVSHCYDFTIHSSDFELIKRYPGKTGYTKQGVDSDEKYIYFSQYKTNCIFVYDWDGNFINEIAVPEQSMELEAIFHIDDVFYITFIKSGAVHLYAATIVQK